MNWSSRDAEYTKSPVIVGIHVSCLAAPANNTDQAPTSARPTQSWRGNGQHTAESARAQFPYLLHDYLSELKLTSFVNLLEGNPQAAFSYSGGDDVVIASSSGPDAVELEDVWTDPSLQKFTMAGYKLVEDPGRVRLFKTASGELIAGFIPCPGLLSASSFGDLFIEDMTNARGKLSPISIEECSGAKVGTSLAVYDDECSEGFRQVFVRTDDTLANLSKTQAIQTLALWQNACFRSWMPQLRESATEGSNGGIQNDHQLSIFRETAFSSATYDFGPGLVARFGTNTSKSGPCAITSGGNYNHTLGGHLIMKDAKLIIQFPPGSTMLLSQSSSSSTVFLPICAGEFKISFSLHAP